MIEQNILDQPKWQLWTGWVLTGLVALFYFLDAGMKLFQLPIVSETLAGLGWPASAAVPLGIVMLISTVLYVVPKTSVLGAVLMTAYLGGAVATHARVGSPIFSHMLFGVYVGVLMWAGLFLKDARVRALLPFRR